MVAKCQAMPDRSKVPGRQVGGRSDDSDNREVTWKYAEEQRYF